jgi:hypothetical protein
MNCDWVKSNLTLYVYHELPDDLHYELRQHVGRCSGCAGELQALESFQEIMSAEPRVEPSPSLLAASRMRLEEALDGAAQQHGWRLLDPMIWLRQLRFSPALAAALLMVGFAGGAGTVWRIASNANTPSIEGAPATAPAEASISGIRSITQQPGTNQVQITYDSVTPQKVEGALNDQRIQQLLLFAARSNTNSGLRMDSVDLLTKNPEQQPIRDALKGALLYDSNPGVRLKALEALGPYVQQDTSVRDAVLEALERDANPGVRANAIHLLQPVRVDGSVRHVLERLSSGDKSEFIRNQSHRILVALPEID